MRICQLEGCDRSLEGKRHVAKYCCSQHRKSAWQSRDYKNTPRKYETCQYEGCEDSLEGKHQLVKYCEYHRGGKERFMEGSATIYFVKAPNGLIKIGVSTDFDMRFKSLQHMSPVILNTIYKFEIDANQAHKKERYLHRLFDDKNSHGEWYRLDTNDIDLIKVVSGNWRGKGIKTELLPSGKRDKAKKMATQLVYLFVIVMVHWLLALGISSVIPTSY